MAIGWYYFVFFVCVSFFFVSVEIAHLRKKKKTMESTTNSTVLLIASINTKHELQYVSQCDTLKSSIISHFKWNNNHKARTLCAEEIFYQSHYTRSWSKQVSFHITASYDVCVCVFVSVGRYVAWLVDLWLK